MKKILILGAGSAIASAYAKLELQAGSKLFLAARSPQKIDFLKNLAAEPGQLKIADFSANETDVKALLATTLEFLGEIDCLLIAYGTFRDQKICQSDSKSALLEIEDNFSTQVRWLTEFAAYFEKRKTGSIAVISSVAGDRGRQSNYVYGAAKAGMNAYLSGLRNRLTPLGIHVLTIKPGYVDTPMTDKMPKNILFAAPERVARDIKHAIDTKKDILYTPWFWRWILTAVCLLPERIFKHLRF